MIKKIPIHQLKPTMYISDLNSGWIPHGPKQTEGRIPDDETIEEIVKLGIKEVYIDTDRGPDVNEGMPEPEVEELRAKRLAKASELTLQQSHRVELEDEINKATKIHDEARRLMEQSLTNVKLGKNVEIEAINDLSHQIVSSVLRNPNALLCLGRIRQKDLYLMEHSINLSVLMTSFGKHLKLGPPILHQASVGALLHDIGKIMVPDEVLHKPGKLDESEWKYMRMHARFSQNILKKTEGITDISIQIAAEHHERIDGTGYPNGLKGDEISFYGKMVAIVDVYDAITADRCYHRGITPTEGLKKLLEWSGDHLDESLVKSFISNIGIYPISSLVQLKSGRLGVVIQQHESDQMTPIVRVFYNAKQRNYIKVETVDLAKSQDEIVGAEDPRVYNINTNDFMQ